MLCRRVSKDYRFDQRIGSKSVCSMEPGTSALPVGIKPADAALPVNIYQNTPANVVCRGSHWDHLLGNINSKREALLVDGREMAPCLIGILMGHVQIHVLFTPLLHLRVNGTGHDITRCQRTSLVVFMHKLFPIQRFEFPPVSSHRFGDQERRPCSGMIECRGVELHELHPFHFSFCTCYHSNPVTCRHSRVGRSLVHRSNATGSHQRHPRQEGVYLTGIAVKYIRTITLDARRVPGYDLSQVMLGKDLYREMALVEIYIGMIPDRFHQAHLYLCPRFILVMQDAKFGVPPLTVQVEVALIILIKIHPPANQFSYLSGGFAYHLLHHLLVA